MTATSGAIPHQIPFRALARVARMEERSAQGTYLVSAADALTDGAEVPSVMVIEAMAQLAGAIVFRSSSEGAMLSAIDAARFDRPIWPGQRVTLEVELEVSFGAMHRFRGVATRDGEVVAEGRFVLTASELSR